MNHKWAYVWNKSKRGLGPIKMRELSDFLFVLKIFNTLDRKRETMTHFILAKIGACYGGCSLSIANTRLI